MLQKFHLTFTNPTTILSSPALLTHAKRTCNYDINLFPIKKKVGKHLKSLSSVKSDVSAAIVKHYGPIAAPALNSECFLFRIQLSIVFGVYLFNDLFLVQLCCQLYSIDRRI